MTGECIIDGTDIAALGVFIIRGGDNDLLSFPARKEPQQNDWYEYDGIDADLSQAYFKEKIVEVGFYITNSVPGRLEERLYGFFDLVSTPGIHQVYVRAFGRAFRLRYLDVPQTKQRGGLIKPGAKSATFTVRFSMDDPSQLFALDSPQPTTPYGGKTYVEVDGTDLCRFGIIVNECYSTVLPYPALKEPLIIKEQYMTGLLAHSAQEQTFDVKQVVVACTMRARSTQEFYQNYEALFRSVTAGEEITLSTFAGDEECFYAEMENFKKLAPFSRRPMASFDLRFTCTESGEANILLATEDGCLIVTEDSDEIDEEFIDMKQYGN
ncbi:MAG: hypothetical protein LBS05_00140 [Tannerellaceae bacterium]|jgi:hypothetical protein|nr:hypothetical protein [Tannerellaceae bacterium]